MDMNTQANIDLQSSTVNVKACKYLQYLNNKRKLSCGIQYTACKYVSVCVPMYVYLYVCTCMCVPEIDLQQ